MSDCEHAAHIFDKFYLMDDFVSGDTCPFCTIATQQAEIESKDRRIKELREAARAVLEATDKARKIYGGTLSFEAATRIDLLAKALEEDNE